MEETKESVRGILVSILKEIGLAQKETGHLELRQMQDLIIKQVHINRILLSAERKKVKRLVREKAFLQQGAFPFSQHVRN